MERVLGVRGNSNEATTAGEQRKKGSEGAQEGGQSQGRA